MKKLKVHILMLAAIMCCSCTIHAESGNFRDIQNRYSGADGCISVKMGKFLIGIARLAGSVLSDGSTEVTAALDMLGNIDRIEVMEMSECPEDVQRHFRKDIGQANEEGFQKLMKVRDGEEDIYVFARMDSGTIRETVIAITGGECIFLRVKGKITPESLARFIEHI